MVIIKTRKKKDETTIMMNKSNKNMEEVEKMIENKMNEKNKTKNNNKQEVNKIRCQIRTRER